MTIEIGDYVKDHNSGRVFKVIGFTKNRAFIADGWIIDKYGTLHNPDLCEKYEGALSAINEAASEIDCGYKVEK